MSTLLELLFDFLIHRIEIIGTFFKKVFGRGGD